jgi:hypothetical protein
MQDDDNDENATASLAKKIPVVSRMCIANIEEQQRQSALVVLVHHVRVVA